MRRKTRVTLVTCLILQEGGVDEEHLKSYGLDPYCFIVVVHSRWKLQKGQEGLEISEDN